MIEGGQQKHNGEVIYDSQPPTQHQQQQPFTTEPTR